MVGFRYQRGRLALLLVRWRWSRLLAGEIVELWFRGLYPGIRPYAGYAEKRPWYDTLTDLRRAEGRKRDRVQRSD